MRSSIQQPQQQQQRPLFRGRSRATDRHSLLDKSIRHSTKQKNKRKKYQNNNNYNPITPANNNSSINDTIDVDDTTTIHHDNDSNGNDSKLVEPSLSSFEQINDPTNKFDGKDQSLTIESNSDIVNENETVLLMMNEVKQLLSRIKNVRRSIHNSASCNLTQMNVYQKNVLNAVQNCVQLWSILLLQLRNHSDCTITNATTTKTDSNTATTTTDNRMDSTTSSCSQTRNPFDGGISNIMQPDNNNNYRALLLLCNNVALKLYELIQLSVQCGPLRGCRPGYFKRCGTDITILVLFHLQSITSYYYNNEDTNTNTKNIKDQYDDDEKIVQPTGTVTEEMTQTRNFCNNNDNKSDKIICDNHDNRDHDDDDSNNANDSDHQQQITCMIGNFEKSVVSSNEHNQEIDNSVDDAYKTTTIMKANIDNNGNNREKSNHRGRNNNVNNNNRYYDDGNGDECSYEDQSCDDDDDQGSTTSDDDEDDVGTSDGSGSSHKNTATKKISNSRCIDTLYFTPKQVQVIGTWMVRCQKQIDSATAQEEPSKSILKQQKQGWKNSQKKKFMQQKKKERRIENYEKQYRNGLF